MAGFFQGVDKALTNLSQSPVGMAGMGLLMMPQQSLTPINPFEYAAQGMQMGVQNRQRAQTLSALQERQRQEDEYRQMKYLMEAQKYQQEMLDRAEAQRRDEEQRAAQESYFSTLSPEEQVLARAGGKDFIKSRFPNNQSATPADLQKYEFARNQGYKGTFMQFMSEMRPTPSPMYSAVPTPQGIMSFNARTGRPEMVAPGVIPAAQDPALAGRRAELTAAGTATGQAQAQAQLGLPQHESIANETISRIDELISHPGMRGAVGAPSIGKAMSFVPGTEEANFMSLFNSIKGRQFLEAFESLKGGGQITEVEGRQATQAISDMNTAQSEEAFVRSANQFRNIVLKGLERARNKAAGGRAPDRQGLGPTGQGQQQETVEDIARKYLQ